MKNLKNKNTKIFLLENDEVLKEKSSLSKKEIDKLQKEKEKEIDKLQKEKEKEIDKLLKEKSSLSKKQIDKLLTKDQQKRIKLTYEYEKNIGYNSDYSLQEVLSLHATDVFIEREIKWYEDLISWHKKFVKDKKIPFHLMSQLYSDMFLYKHNWGYKILSWHHSKLIQIPFTVVK